MLHILDTMFDEMNNHAAEPHGDESNDRLETEPDNDDNNRTTPGPAADDPERSTLDLYQTTAYHEDISHVSSRAPRQSNSSESDTLSPLPTIAGNPFSAALALERQRTKRYDDLRGMQSSWRNRMPRETGRETLSQPSLRVSYSSRQEPTVQKAALLEQNWRERARKPIKTPQNSSASPQPKQSAAMAAQSDPGADSPCSTVNKASSTPAHMSPTLESLGTSRPRQESSPPTTTLNHRARYKITSFVRSGDGKPWSRIHRGDIVSCIDADRIYVPGSQEPDERDVIEVRGRKRMFKKRFFLVIDKMPTHINVRPIVTHGGQGLQYQSDEIKVDSMCIAPFNKATQDGWDDEGAPNDVLYISKQHGKTAMSAQASVRATQTMMLDREEEFEVVAHMNESQVRKVEALEHELKLEAREQDEKDADGWDQWEEAVYSDGDEAAEADNESDAGLQMKIK